MAAEEVVAGPEGAVGVHPVAEDSVEDVVVVVVVALEVAVADGAHPEAEGDLEEAGVAVDSEAAVVEVNKAIIFVHISYCILFSASYTIFKRDTNIH